MDTTSNLCPYRHPSSAANVKKWEIELQTLRESNARLTTALQESAASVEQWKRQFSICRDENDRLRSKVGTAASRTEAWRAGAGGGDGPQKDPFLSLPSPHGQEEDIFISSFNTPIFPLLLVGLQS